MVGCNVGVVFETVSVFGVRAAVFAPGPGYQLPTRLLIPGPGSGIRARATTATDVAEACRPARTRPTAATSVILPGTTTPGDVCGDAATRPCPRTPGDAWAEAALELSGWQRRVQHAEPGPGLAAILADRPDTLAPGVGRGNLLFDAETRWADAVLTSMKARERLIAHLLAAQYADAAELSAHYPGCHDFLPAEIALALSCTESSAQRLLGAAEAFRDKIPATLAALSSGAINETRAAAILTATIPCDPDVAHRVEAAVLPGAASVTAPTVRRRCERAIIAIDPQGAQDRHERRKRERYVSRWAESDGMASLRLYSTAEDVTEIWHAITIAADQAKTPGDGRDLGNRRVDALVDLCTTAMEGERGHVPSGTVVGAGAGTRSGADPDVGTSAGERTGTRAAGRRVRPLIRITMPITALLGADEPCELDGWGPVTADQARAIAVDGVLTRLVCDPLSGTLLDYGRTRYEPPASLKQFVRARDRTCTMPGCAQPAERCDVDHIIAARPDPRTGLPTLGSTADWNLGPSCRHHHLSKDGSGGFRVRRDPDGSYSWTTPLGREYQREPERLWYSPLDHLVVVKERNTLKRTDSGSPDERRPPYGSGDAPPCHDARPRLDTDPPPY